MVIHYPPARLRHNSDQPTAITNVLVTTSGSSSRTGEIPLGSPTCSARTRRGHGTDNHTTIVGNLVDDPMYLVAPASATFIAGQPPVPDRQSNVTAGQGWTGALGPRSRRIDCRIMNVVVVVNTSTSAAASTPVYLAITGLAERSVSSSR
jgi:hypothetical protein